MCFPGVVHHAKNTCAQFIFIKASLSIDSVQRVSIPSSKTQANAPHTDTEANAFGSRERRRLHYRRVSDIAEVVRQRWFSVAQSSALPALCACAALPERRMIPQFIRRRFHLYVTILILDYQASFAKPWCSSTGRSGCGAYLGSILLCVRLS